MDSLSGLINQALETRRNVDLEILGNGYLKLSVSSNEKYEYGLSARFKGNIPPGDSLMYMADFLRDLPVGGMRSSELTLKLRNGEKMDIKQRPVPESIYWLYIVDFFYPLFQDDNPVTDVFVEITKDVYGISFHPWNTSVYPGPFDMDNPPGEGVMMPLSSNPISAHSEEQAREVILRLMQEGRLTEQDIEALRNCNPALIDDLSGIYNLHGLVFQKEPKTTNRDFIRFLSNVPDEVDLVDLRIVYDKIYTSMMNCKTFPHELESAPPAISIDKIPTIEIAGALLVESDIDCLLDHTWERYHSMTGDSIELVKEALL